MTLPRITIDVKRAIPLGRRTWAEAVLAQVTVDPQGGSIALDGQDILLAAPPATCD